jgi:CheY-like chemotaxis protein
MDAAMQGEPYPLPDLTGARVLLVDDVEHERAIVASMLDLTGAAIFEVAGMADAMAVIPSLRPDAVVTELELPDATGFELVRLVRSLDRERQRSTVVIALTRSPAEYPCETARRAGFDGYFTKPPSTDDLTVGLAALLATHRPRQSAA